jgi:hypothetical protein
VVTVNGNEYKLVGLDTCIISDILRDPLVRRGFLRRFSGGHIPCFSVYQTFELRKRTEIYAQFLDLFDVLPCALLKNEDMLFDEERDSYPVPASIDPTLFGFSLLNRSRGTNLENLMRVSFEDPKTARREADWPRLKQEILADWVSMRSGFRPRGSRFTPVDGLRFVNQVTHRQVRERDARWLQLLESGGGNLDVHAFPSLRMTAWSVFFRIYMSKREPELQDVFDAVISTPAPYLDVVVTEGYQADIYGHAKRFEPSLKNLHVLRVRDLRNADGDA